MVLALCIDTQALAHGWFARAHFEMLQCSEMLRISRPSLLHSAASNPSRTSRK